MNVRKTSRLDAEADEKKRKEKWIKEKKSKVQSRKENDEEAVCPHSFDKYDDGTTYSLRGLIHHQHSGLCVKNESDSSAGSK